VGEAIVMELRTRSKNSSRANFYRFMTNYSGKSAQQGFTIIELVAACTIIIIVTFLGIINFNPTEKSKKARDEKRISDIQTIDRAVTEFMLNNKRYPDTENVLRNSSVLPIGSVALNNVNKGWIFENLTAYLPTLPTDPINDATYYYSYIHNVSGYELNAQLEIITDEPTNDGGNDTAVYEVGNNLTLISP